MKKVKAIQIAHSEKLPVDLTDFFGQDTIQKAGELYEQLQRPLIGGLQMGINLRNLNNWVSVLKENPTGTKFKKYTFIEFVWLKTVEQLRNAGLNLTAIADLRANLLEPIKIKGLITKIQKAKNYIDELNLSKNEKEELLQFIASPEYKTAEPVHFNLLHIIIIESIVKKLPLSLAVFLDGTFIILDKSKEPLYTELDKNKLLFDTHIVVSVSAILQRFLRSDLSGFVVPQIGLLSPAENKLFEIVHSGEYESIIIHFKNKKIKTLELKKSENIKERIIDILNKDAFGEILVKKHKGMITKIENTLKVTL